MGPREVMERIQNEKKFSSFSSQSRRKSRVVEKDRNRGRDSLRKSAGRERVGRDSGMRVGTAGEKGFSKETVTRGEGRGGEGRGNEVSSFSRDIGEFIGTEEGEGSREKGENKGSGRGGRGGGELDTEIGEDSGGPLGLLVRLGVREGEKGVTKGMKLTAFNFRDNSRRFQKRKGGLQGDLSPSNNPC